jgi:formate dehydrogenase
MRPVESVAKAGREGETHPHLPPYPDFERYRAEGGYRLLGDCLEGKRTLRQHHQADGGFEPARPWWRGLPTGRKWRFVRAEPGPSLMAINADEGEPGTFKDRHYLETDPHRFLEAC